MTRTFRACSAMLLVAVCACGGRQVTDEAPALGPGELLDPDAYPADFAWQQVVTISWALGSEQFDAVLQKREGALQLVGLGPMGRPGFVVTWDGDEVAVENRTPRELPFDPRYMIADVQRAFYPWCGGLPACDTELHEVTESREAGALRTRSFTRTDALERGTVTITYDAWDAGVPTRVEIDNAWFGYRIEVRTATATRL